MSKRTLGFGDNVFDLLRLYAVIQVMIGHAVSHLQIGLPSFMTSFFSVPGVVILFGISGYLVTASYDRNCETKGGGREYIKKRFFRIFPGLWCSVLISTIVILVLYSVRPSVMETVVYLVTQMLALNFYTGNWLRGYGVGAPNGSLWTIIIELQFYILIMPLWKLLRRKGMFAWLAVILCGLGCNILAGILGCTYGETIVFKLVCNSIVPYLYMFLLGACFYRFRDRLFVLDTWKYVIVLIGLSAIYLFYGNILPGQYIGSIAGACIVCITIMLAYLLKKSIRLPFDISYGIYLYHMIIINALVHLGYVGSKFAFGIAIFGSIIMGFLSWYLVEKRWVKR